MKLNWNDKSNNPQMKDIRNEAVRFYTGIGTATSEDGILSKE